MQFTARVFIIQNQAISFIIVLIFCILLNIIVLPTPCIIIWALCHLHSPVSVMIVRKERTRLSLPQGSSSAILSITIPAVCTFADVFRFNIRKY